MTTTISGTNGVSQCDTDSVSTNDIQNAAITAAKLSGAQTGSAPIYGCRAWCVFDGTLTGTNAPTAGGNVTSVTRNAAGDYTINFTTAMPSANYAAVAICNVNITGSASRFASGPYNQAPTTTTYRIICSPYTGAAEDQKYVQIAIFC